MPESPTTVRPYTPEEHARTRATLAANAERVVLAPGSTVREETVGGRPGLRVTPASGGGAGRGLFLHGGGYRAGSPRGALGTASRVAAGSDVEVVLPAYRLAPEDPFPAALDDIVRALAELADEEPDPARTVVLGTSAGGGLAAAAVLAARATGVAAPGALVLLSPWLDLTAGSPSYERCAATDEIISREGSLRSAAGYLGGADPRDPLASPLFAGDQELGALPRTLVQVGDREVLVDEAGSFVRRVADAGGSALLETWPGVGHCWHQTAPDDGPADAAIERIRKYIEN